ncbi:MAG: hypothetical protein ACXVBZ_11150 [Flavisolibacter sp.]
MENYQYGNHRDHPSNQNLKWGVMFQMNSYPTYQRSEQGQHITLGSALSRMSQGPSSPKGPANGLKAVTGSLWTSLPFSEVRKNEGDWK